MKQDSEEIPVGKRRQDAGDYGSFDNANQFMQSLFVLCLCRSARGSGRLLIGFHALALVRIKLLLNGRLPQVMRIGKEFHIAGFTDPAHGSVPDSLYDTKATRLHRSSLPQTGVDG
jgi:hypothetical protein